MISVQEATSLVLSSSFPDEVESIPLRKALGRQLASAVLADRDLPPFDRVTLDGIAIRADDAAKALRTFSITGRQMAGEPPRTLRVTGEAVEIMTGASLPAEAGAVVPVEHLEIENGVATVTGSIRLGQGIHPQGSDHAKGSVLLERGQRIGPAELAVAAAVGAANLQVSRRPRVFILTTGDELVPVEQAPAPQQIRSSNPFAIEALVEPWAHSVTCRHVMDDPKELRAVIGEALDQHDLLISSGAVSKGASDFLPGIYAELGVAEVFHRVAQRPGKPLWFGRRDDVTVFGLPGNPVSTTVCTLRYVLLWLRAAVGAEPLPGAMAILDSKPEPFHLTRFVPATLSEKEASRHAVPRAMNTSGDLASLVGADGVVEIAPSFEGHLAPWWPMPK